jgi:hypothetical protein
MIARLVIMFAIAAPALAHAGHHHCRESSSIVGYEICSRYGLWGFGSRLSFDLGVSSLRLDARDIDADATPPGTRMQLRYAAVAGDDRPVTAAGGRMRYAIGLGRTFYLTSQIDLASITGGPDLAADTSSRGTSPMVTETSGGLILQCAFLVGVHRRLGPVSFGAEVGPAIRAAFFSLHDVAGASPAVQAWVAPVAQPAVDIWLSPQLTLGVQAGVDLAEPKNLSAALVLGMHLTPYDMTRTL